MHQIVISSARKRPCIIGPSEREVFLPFGARNDNLLNIVGCGRDEVSERAFLLRFSLIKSSSSKLGRWSA
jgi:hypothetical protein